MYKMARLIKQQLTAQVIEHLKNVIASGKYGMGAKLPADPKLSVTSALIDHHCKALSITQNKKRGR
jgi:hypothetical protein